MLGPSADSIKLNRSQGKTPSVGATETPPKITKSRNQKSEREGTTKTEKRSKKPKSKTEKKRPRKNNRQNAI